ncbi:MAG: hypothetical protein COY58_00785 [Gammaproteobacteria bacterium CG_4_10_14_0_8_um_filter_38_16]|nr:MAG: hypothetical protein COY58_00785 [Gammaproteobacteria bacterium CG_4_10_14_0_8_um_filter_38_16]PJA04333.1 MAG: hypothetical protein COX72_00715 [Gammaproteobacteria bacterium CG_4_10_14_0_2_um_filter_38_22]PJB10087.1 MAG: hypothetical protein CO120_06725 [Gammaproteobacteria bacterium CG_4_9_14_3_um_filter_38_9]
MVGFIELIHVLCGVSFFGLMVTSFVYISNSMRQQNPTLLRFAIKTSLLVDRFIFLILVMQFVTGTFMVRHDQLSFHTPWIIVAYVALSLVGVIWFLLMLIKYVNRTQAHFRYQILFYFLNVLLILLFCIIIHDALMQQTWFWK